MIGPLTAFILVSTLSPSVEDQIPVNVVQPGDDVMIKCSGSDGYRSRITWYRQIPGQTIQFIAEVYYEDSFKDKSFSFTIKDNLCVMNIRNVRKDDEAIYYCQKKTGHVQDLIGSTFLIVHDEENSRNCVHDVRQSPSSASVASGGSVSLQCSLQSKDDTKVQCPQHHKVLWFRAGSEELNTGVMYNFTNNSCVYTLSKTIGHSSDTGTYYCAVDACGHVLFGDGTRVEMDQPPGQDLDPVTVALSVLLSCCVLVIIVLCVCLKRVYAQDSDASDYINCPRDNTPRSLSQTTIMTKKEDCETALLRTTEAAETESVYTYVTFVYVE